MEQPNIKHVVASLYRIYYGRRTSSSCDGRVRTLNVRAAAIGEHVSAKLSLERDGSFEGGGVAWPRLQI